MSVRALAVALVLALAACSGGKDAPPDPIEPQGCTPPCGAHASCVTVGQSHACVCDQKFAGDGFVCGQTCASTGLQCGAHGQCDDSRGAPVCQCESGYAGTTCAECASPYQDNDGDGTCALSCAVSCGPHSQCSDGTGARVCTCDAGYVGADCTTCDAGYQDNDLDGNCAPDCPTSGIDCGAHGACNDGWGTATCACDGGYAGSACERCATGYQDHDGDGVCAADCATADLAGCGGFGTCSDASGAAACACDALAHACGRTCCPDMVAVSVGQSYGCAVSAANGIECWGDNEFGQLGSLPVTQSNPRPLEGPAFADAILSLATGQHHTCVALSTGEMSCWGYNGQGQLGVGSDPLITWTPQTVPIALDATTPQITCGGYYTCAVTSAGGVECWGANERGQLGDGSFVARSSPVHVVGLSSGVRTVVAGGHFSGWQHTCALMNTGAVKCWGDDSAGQLGDGTPYPNSSVPVDVAGLGTDVTALAVGPKISCALLGSGTVKCWGTPGLTPTTMPGLESDVVAIAVRESQLCAIKAGGRLQCQGANGYGQLGDGTTISRATLVDVQGMTSGTSVVAPGLEHACAVTDSGDVLCWGRRIFGEVGDGLLNGNQITPLRVRFPRRY